MAEQDQLTRKLETLNRAYANPNISDQGRALIKQRMLDVGTQLRVLSEGGLDKRTGIEPGQRAKLGATTSREEALAYLGSQFPEGVGPLPGGEYAVKSQGEWRRANPAGLDLGDITGLAAPAARATGSILGAIGGGLTPAGPTGAILGAGAGEAAGGQIADYFLRPEYKPTIGQRAADIATDFAFGAVPEGVGQVGSKLGRSLLSKTVGRAADAQAMARVYEAQGMTPSSRAALVPESATLPGMVGGLESNTLIGKGAIQKGFERADESFTNRIGELTDFQTRESAGSLAKEAIDKYAKARRATTGEPFREFADVMENVPVPLTRTAPFAQESLARVEASPLGNVAYSNPTVAGIARNVEGVPNPTENWLTLQTARAQVAPDAAPLAGRPAGELEQVRLYGAMTEDMEAALARQGLGPQYEAAKGAYKTMKDELKRLGKKIPDDATPERVVDTLISTARTSPTELASIRMAVEGGDPAAWTAVQQTILHDLAKSTPGKGSDTSMTSFLTNLNKLGKGTDSPQALDALFGAGTPIRKNIEDLRLIAEAEKNARKELNVSKTANAPALGVIGPALIGAAGYGAMGPMGMLTAAAPLVGGNILARWLSRPGFMEAALRASADSAGDPRLFSRLLSQSLANPMEEQHQ